MENSPSIRSRILTGFAALVGLLVLYVLSIGPVVYCQMRYDIDTKRLGNFYRPVMWLMTESPAGPPLMDYMTWWTDRGVTHRSKLPP